VRSALFIAIVGLLTGCARYEFNLVEPPDLAQHIGSKSFVMVRVDPLEYRFRAAEGRLVMLITNPTGEPVAFMGDRSAVVDAGGQSHPMPSQTIAAGSYIKLILPPYRPRIEPYGPTFGFGIGTRVDARPAPVFDYDDYPRYFTVYGGVNESMYWEWDDEGRVKLMLAYRRGEKEFQHRFTIGRQKM
jgi:hypothetical protein